MANELKVGELIKSIREEAGLSLQAAAEATGLTSAVLSQYENHMISPPLGALFKLSRALKVPVARLLGETNKSDFVVVRSNEREPTSRFASKEGVNFGYSYESLAPGKVNRKMEPFIVNLELETLKNDKLSVHEGEEFIMVIEGCMEVQLGDYTDTLSPGDTIYYDSTIPHKVSCHKGVPTKILAVLHSG